jgi:glycosyltransferase involved in cell wall biosynthesis
MSPLVSFVVAAFNLESFISETLDSILAQTHTNIEVIVVDDGSVDGTRDVVKRYASMDSRVSLVEKSKNEGALLAKLDGLRRARGDYFIICDGDDLCSANLAQRSVESIGAADCVMFQFENVDFSNGERYPCYPGAQTMRRITSGEELTPLDWSGMCHVMWICCYKASCREELLRAFEGTLPVPFFEDVLSYLATMASFKVKVIPDILYSYRINRPGQSITDWWAKRRATKYQCFDLVLERAHRCGYLAAPFERRIAFFKVLRIAFSETWGLLRNNPKEIRNLQKALRPHLRSLYRYEDAWATKLSVSLFYLVFMFIPGSFIANVGRRVPEIRDRLRK